MVNAPIKIVVANDYALVLAGLLRMLRPFADRVVVEEAVLVHGGDSRSDIALLDTFGVTNVGHRVRQVLTDGAPRVVVYSWNVDPEAVQAATDAGAWGFISKQVDAETVVHLLEAVHRGEPFDSTALVDPPDPGSGTPDARGWPGEVDGLSEREAEILALIAQGHSNEDVARAMFLSNNTIKSYIRSAYRKIGVISRTQAVLWAIDHGLRNQKPRPPAEGAL